MIELMHLAWPGIKGLQRRLPMNKTEFKQERQCILNDWPHMDIVNLCRMEEP